MRILIVDDQPFALELLRRELTKGRHEVLSATNGVEALELLEREACRLVISDWDMPEMDGLELCRRIRSRDASSYVYFILLTAREGKSHTVEALSAGADEFLTKPFDSTELRVRVRGVERQLSAETRDVTIFALAKLAESRDPETGAHLERVRNYARLLAKQLHGDPVHPEVDEEFVDLVFATSPLHDIGKVGVPDGILLKPGAYSEPEFGVMKAHTLIGAATLDAAAEQFPEVRFLQIARDIALTHHERYNGSGYPHGLAGDDIPLCGRIVALADVYDALTSQRVYKSAFAHGVARDIILEESGKQFDPAVVHAFEQCEEQFVDVLRSRAVSAAPVA